MPTGWIYQQGNLGSNQKMNNKRRAVLLEEANTLLQSILGDRIVREDRQQP